MRQSWSQDVSLRQWLEHHSPACVLQISSMSATDVRQPTLLLSWSNRCWGPDNLNHSKVRQLRSWSLLFLSLVLFLNGVTGCNYSLRWLICRAYEDAPRSRKHLMVGSTNPSFVCVVDGVYGGRKDLRRTIFPSRIILYPYSSDLFWICWGCRCPA